MVCRSLSLPPPVRCYNTHKHCGTEQQHQSSSVGRGGGCVNHGAQPCAFRRKRGENSWPVFIYVVADAQFHDFCAIRRWRNISRDPCASLSVRMHFSLAKNAVSYVIYRSGVYLYTHSGPILWQLHGLTTKANIIWMYNYNCVSVSAYILTDLSVVRRRFSFLSRLKLYTNYYIKCLMILFGGKTNWSWRVQF